jgi:hypothetical protein
MKLRLLLFAALLLTLLGPLTVLAASLVASYVDVEVTYTTFITVTRSSSVEYLELSSYGVPASYGPIPDQGSHCLFDACMQEFLIFSSSLAPICATYTATQDTCIESFPSRVSRYCSSSPTMVSSACSCLMASLFPFSAHSSLLSGTSHASITEPNKSRTSSSQIKSAPPSSAQTIVSQVSSSRINSSPPKSSLLSNSPPNNSQPASSQAPVTKSSFDFQRVSYQPQRQAQIFSDFGF